ncbi:MAG: hypothetical protein WBJ19_00390 [Rhodoferax sp.]
MSEETELFTWPQMLWTRTRTCRFESAWIAIQRFMYLNDLSGSDFLHLIALPRRSRRTLDVSRLASGWRWDNCTRYDNPTTRIFYRDIEEGRTTADFSSHRYLIDPKREIRYCPRCLRHCFHWPFFQFSAVTHCPLHNEELLTHCQNCGASIGNGLFIANWLTRPLVCPSCQAPFAKRNLGRRVTDGFPAGEEVFMKATSLLNRLMQVSVQDLHHHDEFDFKSAAVSKLYFNCLFKTANPEEPHPRWLFGLDVSVRGPFLGKTSSGVDEVVPHKVDVPEETVEGKLISLNCIYKAVGRYLKRRVHRICGHARGPQLRFSSEYVPFAGNEYYLLMSPNACPCCAVLEWWRARLSSQFGLLHFFRKFFGDDPHLLADYRSWIEDLFPLESKEAAFVAQSIFSSLSLRMLSLLDGTCEDVRLLNDLYRGFMVRATPTVRTTDIRLQQQFGEDDLRLYVPRGHVVPETIRTELDGSQRDFGFSLSAAFTALERCHAVRKKGLLWVPRNVLSASCIQRSSTPPYWYEDLARHANERHWHSARSYAWHWSQQVRKG